MKIEEIRDGLEYYFVDGEEVRLVKVKRRLRERVQVRDSNFVNFTCSSDKLYGSKESALWALKRWLDLKKDEIRQICKRDIELLISGYKESEKELEEMKEIDHG